MTEYVCVLVSQGVLSPSMAEVASGAARSTTISFDVEGPFPQLLDGVTKIVPDKAPVVNVMDAVPCPDTSVQSEGKVQVYVTNGIELTEYVCVDP